jgi:hypothetical protein
MQSTACGERRIEFNPVFCRAATSKTNRPLTPRDKKLNSFLDVFGGMEMAHSVVSDKSPFVNPNGIG